MQLLAIDFSLNYCLNVKPKKLRRVFIMSSSIFFPLWQNYHLAMRVL